MNRSCPSFPTLCVRPIDRVVIRMCCLYDVCVPSGDTRCDGQPAVYPGGDSVEDLLEVQPESGWRRHAGCVSGQKLFKIQSQTKVRGFSSRRSTTI